MSPSPRLRAMSTSSVVSRVYDANPSTSPGAMAASSSASLMASSASRFSDRSMALANSVCPTPAIAVRSRISTTAIPVHSNTNLCCCALDFGGRGSLLHRQGVEGDDALREDDQRVDVELG